VLLQRLFCGFPGGFPGMSLLLLRAVLAGAVLVEGRFCLSESASHTADLWGALAFASGILLLIGFLTPVVAVLTGLGGVGVLLSIFPSCNQNMFNSSWALAFAVSMLVTIVAVGPGRFSLDARIFGRRKIIIPPRDCSPETST
jgi:uncharacterized membrane protein YphA (DoxX/SURF4 family)